mgnify:CR=1 FL=1|jgi:SNF2 family DNA or RNA helicase
MAVKIIIDLPMNLKADRALLITFPYDAKIVNVMRGFERKFWHPQKKMWELPFNCLETLKQQLSLIKVDFDIFDQLTIVGYNEADKEKLKDCGVQHEYKTQPRQHQIEGFNYGMNSQKWLLADDQGLGKTFQTLNIALAKRNQSWFKHCLIVVGVNNLKLNWYHEIEKHTNEIPYILGQRVLKRGPNKGKLAFKDSKEKLEDLNSDIDNFFLIINVEALRNTEISERLKYMCKTGEIGMVIADEIHKCKDPNSQQGKGFQKLLSKERIAVSGTPLMNSIEDLYIILKWLDYETHTFTQFKNHYCVYGGFGDNSIIAYKNKKEIIQKLNQCMLRRKKEEVTDLPEKNLIPIYLDMSKEEWKLYDEVRTALREQIDKIKLSPNPLAQLIRLRQVTGLSSLLSSKATQTSKLDMMMKIIDDCVKNEEKVVIFSEFSQIIEEAFKRCKKYNPVKITGDVKLTERDLAVQKFQETENCKVILGTRQAMGTGITLTAGNNVIFLDEPWNEANKNQAMDRCHRIGTTKIVNVYTLMCQDTIDEVVNEIVMKKGELSKYFIDGQTTNRQFVNELLIRVLGED